VIIFTILLCNMTKTYLLAAILALIAYTTTAQSTMRPVEELVNTADPGWPLVKEWIDAGKNKVEILTTDDAQAREALYQTQVTTRSPMGAIVYTTGGLLVDDGWIRIFGSGNPKLTRSLPGWNKGKAAPTAAGVPAFLLIADDALGGFFLLNGGGLGGDPGKVYYLAPDNLEYEPLGINYTEFLLFCFNNDLNDFYQGLRWATWREDVASLGGDNVFSFIPYLWTKEGKDISKSSRKAVPVEEQYRLIVSLRRQLGFEH
jgi:hypothetical protein